MDNTNFTKGKWVANYKVGSCLIQDEETYRDGLKGCLAEVYYFDDAIYTGEHNALLISKAPEMLEMLKDSVEVIKWYMENSTTELHEPFFNIGANQIEQTEQLIRKATEL